MRLTDIQKNELAKVFFNKIKKSAYFYSRKFSLDQDEVFSEGLLGLAIALDRLDTEKIKNAISVEVYINLHVYGHMKDYCKQEIFIKNKNCELNLDSLPDPASEEEANNFLLLLEEVLSPEEKKLLELKKKGTPLTNINLKYQWNTRKRLEHSTRKKAEKLKKLTGFCL
jgi:DNA-directed RNA polymerase specialized sigma subunit